MKLPRRWDRISTSLAAVLNYLLGRGQQRFLIRLRVVMIWNKSREHVLFVGAFPDLGRRSEASFRGRRCLLDCVDAIPKCPSEEFLISLNHLDSIGPILIRGGGYIVDGQEPSEVRPRSLEISERPD